ncbi:uncharacterized protein ColSpa_01199 [Colletotrichum spaethianum]|uniref:Uncharacterized protein n=1 Tax=Colletotrichum spaethianum TaxID=700344 RepID=A0AA37NYC6_9PEZI|nr:uncharacterized protein ColSpa_01199 [Colletotrichum spaethianum]GKT41018.1 hypothetical protein ColSpa_01199 [Colletotrichum spaethianum]
MTNGWDANSWDIQSDGVFFDEGNNAPAWLQYFTDVSDYAKSKTTMVVLNPGPIMNPNSFALYNVADALLSIETGCKSDPDAPQDRCPRNT